MQVIKEICRRDSRYHPRSYVFVLEALDYTGKKLNKHALEGAERHVSGGELLEGIRAYALEQFGPMALTVLDNWGVRTTEDFGEIVFNLVEAGKLRKTDQDNRKDFVHGYNFREAFTRPFLPDQTEPCMLVTDRKQKSKKKVKRKGTRDDGRKE